MYSSPAPYYDSPAMNFSTHPAHSVSFPAQHREYPSYSGSYSRGDLPVSYQPALGSTAGFGQHYSGSYSRRDMPVGYDAAMGSAPGFEQNYSGSYSRRDLPTAYDVNQSYPQYNQDVRYSAPAPIQHGGFDAASTMPQYTHQDMYSPATVPQNGFSADPAVYPRYSPQDASTPQLPVPAQNPSSGPREPGLMALLKRQMNGTPKAAKMPASAASNAHPSQPVAYGPVYAGGAPQFEPQYQPQYQPNGYGAPMAPPMQAPAPVVATGMDGLYFRAGVDSKPNNISSQANPEDAVHYERPVPLDCHPAKAFEFLLLALRIKGATILSADEPFYVACRNGKIFLEFSIDEMQHFIHFRGNGGSTRTLRKTVQGIFKEYWPRAHSMTLP